MIEFGKDVVVARSCVTCRCTETRDLNRGCDECGAESEVKSLASHMLRMAGGNILLNNLKIVDKENEMYLLSTIFHHYNIPPHNNPATLVCCVE